ncbi:MAG TPA: serine/threonine-protein kinase [Nitrospiraceae bacterium]|nr:serine/threonine-protein kinase [Nitrospiraceae bacterium]
MPKSWSWIAPYTFAILAVLLAGPLLSSLTLVQSISVPYLQLSGPQAIRLGSSLFALAILWLLACAASQYIPGHGHGSRFLRHLVIPLTTFIVILFANKTFKSTGLPLIEQMGPSRFALGYAIGLVASGFWLTTAWILNRSSLCAAFDTSSQSRHQTPQALSESSGSRQEEVPAETPPEPKSAAPTSRITSYTPGMLGRYRVLKELGSGAMGLVYLGKDPTIQRFVAIKTMRLDRIESDDKLQDIKSRFFREAESTGRLSHPNIVTIYDAGEEHDLGYIAMELIEGTPLKQWARKPNLMPVNEVLLTVATVADALDYAHQQGVVHRDIKPANIMLTRDRVVKVMDFGIAKMASSSKTQTNIVLGTPTYMSPEQIAGKKVDGRSDIFSLGIVLFELLTGQLPFTADNLSAVLFSIAHHPHPAIQTLRPDLPLMVQEVVDRALQKELPHRYRRAEEFAVELRASVQSLAA